MKTKLEILEETAAFYNSKNRSIGNMTGGDCVYVGPHDERCAVSRCCNDDDTLRLASNEGLGAVQLFNRLGFGILKPEYRIENAYFWKDLQNLHDRADFWDEKGLTKEGQEYYETLKKKYTDEGSNEQAGN